MKRMLLAPTLLAFALLAGLVVAASPATASPKVDTERFAINQATLPFNALAGATAYYGVEENGAGWRIEVPDNWNGDLVLYAHGYAGAGATLNVQNPSLRAYFIANGYAWAASSYQANGYVPGTGAEDTYDLLKIFRRETGLDKPERVYLYGVSMGGHVVGHMVERWPETFAGALPVCGVMGDNELFDFFQDLYLVAETLVGNEPIVPTPADYYTNPAAGWQVTRTLLGNPYPTNLTPLGETFKQSVEMFSGGDRPVFDEGWVGPSGGAFAFNFGSATAGPGRENFDTVYQFDTNLALAADEQLFNDTIIRITAETSDRNPQGIYTNTTSSPALTGKFRVPVLTLHTLGELFVPFSMEQIYAQRAAEAGNADLLVQRAIRGRSHCEFLASELTTAFDDLVAWVEDGVKPAGDDILDPVAVASPTFGCQFTTVDHALVPPCP